MSENALVAQITNDVSARRIVATTHHVTIDAGKHNFDLIQPGTVLGQRNEADPMRRIRQKLTAAGHCFQDVAPFDFP
nr:hypothetical protein [Gimesia aquarii]